MHVQLSHFARNGWTGVRHSETYQWIMDRDEVTGGDSLIPPVVLRVIGLANDIIYIVGKFFFNLFHPRVYSQEIVENGGKEKPIIFTGVSNGARISAQVATQLKCDHRISNPVKVHAAAGPFFGTHTVRPPFPAAILKICQWLLRTWLFKRISQEFIEEVTWAGNRCKQLISQMKFGAEAGVEFCFYSSRGDSMVRRTVSGFPKGIQDANYRMFTYQGHSSIIKAVTPYVVKSVASVVG